MAKGHMLVAAKNEGMEFITRIAFALNFLVAALAVALFYFDIKVDNDSALVISPWMGVAAMVYIAIQIASVVVAKEHTRMGAAGDIILAGIMVFYIWGMVLFSGKVSVTSEWTMSWPDTGNLFQDDFIRNFGLAAVVEFVLLLTMYLLYMFQKTEVSGSSA